MSAKGTGARKPLTWGEVRRLEATNAKLRAALSAVVAWDDASEEYDLGALDELPGIIEQARAAIAEATSAPK